MIGFKFIKNILKIILLLLIVKCCLFASYLFNLMPGISDQAVQASAKKQVASQKDKPVYKKDSCHPELISMLHLKMAKLDERQRLLDSKEQDLKLLERDINEKIKLLKDLQRKLEGPLKKKQYEEQARLQHLAGVYSSMDPVRAAALLDKMDEETVTKLFAIMKSKKVAMILANMSPEKAARISSYLYKDSDEE